jgi:STE24 endopeptidase
VLPAVALSVALASLLLGSASNVLSRQVEARADAFALRLVGDPAAFEDFEKRIAVRNVSDPDPPAITQFLFGTHPTTVERIGIGEAFRAGEGR